MIETKMESLAAGLNGSAVAEYEGTVIESAWEPHSLDATGVADDAIHKVKEELPVVDSPKGGPNRI